MGLGMLMSKPCKFQFKLQCLGLVSFNLLHAVAVSRLYIFHPAVSASFQVLCFDRVGSGAGEMQVTHLTPAPEQGGALSVHANGEVRAAHVRLRT